MNHVPQRFYEFDSFLIDSQQRLLLLDGQPVDLTPKVFDVLFELVQNSGRLVEKKELMEQVWPDSFVEEANLTQHISTLRKRLAQHSGRERYILTVPGRGYRFVAGVKEWNDDAVTTVLQRIRSRVIIDVNAIGDVQPVALAQGEAEVVFQETRIRTCEPASDPTVALPAPPAGSSRHAGLVFVFSAALVVCGLGFALYKTIGRLKAAPFSRTSLVKFTTSGKTSCVAVSPDGKYVAFAVAEAGKQSLVLRQVDTSSPGVEISPAADSQYLDLAFSPDGKYLYYVASFRSPNMLQRIPVLGGTPARLVEDVDSAPGFSPDGKQIVYLRGYPDLRETALLIANADGSGERKLASLEAAKGSFTLSGAPSWSPDGTKVVSGVSRIDEAGEYQELCEVQVADGTLKSITRGRWLHVGRAAWLAGGQGLVMLATDQETGLAQIWHVSYPDGAVRKITNDLNEYRNLSLTADAKVIAVVQAVQSTNVWLVPDYDAARAVQVTSGNFDGIEGLAWLPDGRVTYTTWTNGVQKLWLGDQAKGAQRQLIESTSSEGSVAVSPDGRLVVFSSKRGGQQHLWKMDADGAHLQELTSGIRDSSPVFSPDGKWVIFRSYFATSPNLFKVPINGGPMVRLTTRLSGPPAISPDGKTIACAYREVALSPNKLALIPFAGGEPIRQLDFTESPRKLICRWTNDGKSVTYAGTRGGISNIWAQPIDGGSPLQMTDFKADLIFNFVISPDGHQLAAARGRVANDVVLIRRLD